MQDNLWLQNKQNINMYGFHVHHLRIYAHTTVRMTTNNSDTKYCATKFSESTPQNN